MNLSKSLLQYAKELKLLIVEDDIHLREEFYETYKYLFKTIDMAENGADGLKSYENNRHDLVITDLSMPIMNGLEMIKRIRLINPEQKIIALSAHNQSAILVDLIQAGVQSFILKPSSKDEILKVLIPVCRDAYHQRLNIDYILELNQEIIDTQREIVVIMGGIAEAKSKETGLHVQRVAHYSKLLGQLHGLDDSEAELIQMASPMHDIGKIGIPDFILHKPGKLDAQEWDVMQTHAQMGYDMLKISQRPILKAASMIALDHHEKWNGTGYPNQKKEEEIHIYGRITAIADVFDALGSDRVYKKAWELPKILDFFEAEKGEHFDPNLIDLFMQNLDQFLEIRERFKEK